jgi:hypothetical protein
MSGLFWEYVTPLYLDSTGDPYDVLAYALGGMSYLLIHDRSVEQLA